MNKKDKKDEGANKEAENSSSLRDDYAPQAEDFKMITASAIESLQEMGPREIKRTSLFLSGRWGTICTTDINGIPKIISSSLERDAKGRERRQRFFIGLRAEAVTKDRVVKGENLRKKRMPKPFEVTSSANKMMEIIIPPAQDAGDKIQRKIDEENYEWFPMNFEPAQRVSVNLDPEFDPDLVLMKNLTTTAYSIVTESLGGKADKVEVSLSKWTEAWVYSDSLGTAIDVLIPRARLSILVKTKDGSEAFGIIGGACGTLKEMLARYVPKKEEISEEKMVKDPDIINTDIYVVVGRLAKRVVKEAIDLDRAQNATILGNECFAIFSPQVAGVFGHEIIGHSSEGDIICENRRSKSAKVQLKSMIGAQVSDHPRFTVIDTPEPDLNLSENRAIRYNWGSLPGYDEYGVKAKPTFLIKDGVRVGALLNYYTLEEVIGGLKEEVAEAMRKHGHSGNSRSEKYDVPPLIRMRNTFILPDEAGPGSLETMAALIPKNQKGAYIKSVKGGWINTEDGTFMIEGNLSYLIENGLVTDKPLKNVRVTGNIGKLQSNIKAIGKAKTMHHTFAGWCGKNDQWVPVDGSGPILLLEKVSLAGGSFFPWAKIVEEYDRQHKEVLEGKRSDEDIHIPEFSEASGHSSQKCLCLATAFLPVEKEVEIILGIRRDKATHFMADDGTAVERGNVYEC